MPTAIAVNTATNKIYVTNEQSNSVTVIDGATNATTTVPVGIGPDAIAVNIVTNKVYVAGYGADNGGVINVGDYNSVTVIDGATNATTPVPVGIGSMSIAVNMVTNKIYEIDEDVGGATVKMIDGATNATTTVKVPNGLGGDVAVNMATNKIYVTERIPGIANTVTEIDGSTNATTQIPVGVYGGYIGVNSVTNRIYVTNIASNSVTVIDGATNATITVPTGTNPNGIAVNPVTNRIYVANNGSGDVTVIDGATNATTTVPVGVGPFAIAVNPVTNMVYVPVYGSLTAIDGVTNATSTLATGVGSVVAVNPVTNMVYDNLGESYVTATAGSTAVRVGGSSRARIVNISTRAQVGTGGNILIPGLVIGGSGIEAVLIRGDGPSLAQFGVTGVLAHPILSVFDSTGKMIATNAGWSTSPDAPQIASTAAQVGAYALAAGSADSAVIVNLPSGAYTVQISGVNNTTGVALAEVYEISSTGTRLVNLSTRAQVGTGGNIIIPGLVISGDGTEKLLVRADGPGLAQFGVTGILAQPSLSVFDNTGKAVASNLGWTSAGPDLIAGFENVVGAFSLTPGSADSAQIVSLAAGAYTLPISGANNTTGVALAEVYEAP